MAPIPDARGVIHGCYAKSGGQLKVIDTAKGEKCPTGYTALDWNKHGIAGTNGTTASTASMALMVRTSKARIDGVDGAQGEVGPSDAYATFTQSPGTILCANYVTVKSLSLPPGSYTASATAMLLADELSERASADCFMSVGNPVVWVGSGQAAGHLPPDPAGGVYANLASQLSFILPVGGDTLVFKCRGANAGVDNVNLTAIRVGSLNVS